MCLRSDSLDMSMAELQAFFPSKTSSSSKTVRFQRTHPSKERKGSDGSLMFSTPTVRRGSDDSIKSNESSSLSLSLSSESANRLTELLYDSCYSAPRRRIKDDKLDSTGKLQELVDCYIMLYLEEIMGEDVY